MFPAGSQLLYLGKQAFFPSFLSWIDLILLIYISILYDEIVGVSHIHVWMYVCIISILIFIHFMWQLWTHSVAHVWVYFHLKYYITVRPSFLLRFVPDRSSVADCQWLSDCRFEHTSQANVPRSYQRLTIFPPATILIPTALWLLFRANRGR